MNSEEQIKAWLSKKEWTDEEKVAFLQYLQNGHADEVRHLLEKEFYENSSDRIDRAHSERMLKNILEQSHISGGSKTRRLWIPFMAAASVIVLIFSAYFFLRNKRTETPMAQAAPAVLQKEIMPGGNKAILTLANGNKIDLDSVKNGKLGLSGNLQIIKLDDGKLAYQSAGGEDVKAVEFNTISTPRGGQYAVELADGSKVWLNAASSITFPTSFIGKTREVKITGEAYFEVAHNAEKPFRVIVNDLSVEVLGTHFNINAYGDEGVIKTTLLQGSVKVTEGGHTELLKPGQQAQLETINDQLQTTSNIDLDEVMAWKNGMFYFDDADIESVMRQLSKWYDVDVVYQGNIPERRFEGKMQRSLTLSQALNLLAKNKVNFQIEGRKIIVKQ